mgnify:CR=1 FL=1
MPITQIETYLDGLSNLQRDYYDQFKALIESVYPKVKVYLFAKQPYFYLEEHESINFHRRPSIMMAFFKDHVNIFSTANAIFQSRLPMYTFTEKHTLQIYFDQRLEDDVLKELFKASLILDK